MSENASPLFTISIPTYNRADGYLRETLTSACQQTYDNLEIMVSDNCSPDHTDQVVKSFRDPRIRYVKHKKNLGHGGNFNFCVEGARGKYVLVLHDDDLIEPDFFETFANQLDHDEEYVMLRSGVNVIDEVGNKLETLPNQSNGDTGVKGFLNDWFDGAPLYMCNSIYNRQKLIDIGGFYSRHELFHDVASVVKLVSTGPRLEIEQPMASFRRHGASDGGSASVENWADDCVYLREVIEEKTNNDEHIAQRANAYLCRKMYRFVSRRSMSPVKRLLHYRKLDELFDHSYPYLKFIWQQFRASLRNK